MVTLSVRILGCGSSGGVPRLGGHWGACDPENPKNARTRCSLLITRTSDAGSTRVLVDTSPDLRHQLLAAHVGELDGVVYTHAHADHVHGLDDLRMVFFNTRKRLDVYADADTSDALLSRFGYAFVQPEGSLYPPICELHYLEEQVTINGAGGPITLAPLSVAHGPIEALGLKFDDICYMPDVSDIPEAVWPELSGLRLWIVDALRREPHPTHSHLENTLRWIARASPERAVLTNMHIDLDYETLAHETPDIVSPAYDGMELHLPAYPHV